MTRTVVLTCSVLLVLVFIEVHARHYVIPSQQADQLQQYSQFITRNSQNPNSNLRLRRKAKPPVSYHTQHAEFYRPNSGPPSYAPSSSNHNKQFYQPPSYDNEHYQAPSFDSSLFEQSFEPSSHQPTFKKQINSKSLLKPVDHIHSETRQERQSAQERQADKGPGTYVDFGAHTGQNGAFGWYADFPVNKAS